MGASRSLFTVSSGTDGPCFSPALLLWRGFFVRVFSVFFLPGEGVLKCGQKI